MRNQLALTEVNDTSVASHVFCITLSASDVAASKIQLHNNSGLIMGFVLFVKNLVFLNQSVS